MRVAKFQAKVTDLRTKEVLTFDDFAMWCTSYGLVERIVVNGQKYKNDLYDIQLLIFTND